MEGEVAFERARAETGELRPLADVEPAEKAPRLAVTPTRRPFCRASVELESQDWVACEGCLARHHATCWRENGACSSCRGTRRLVPRRDRPSERRSVALVALALIVLVGIVIAARAVLRETQGEARARVAALEARSQKAEQALDTRLAAVEKRASVAEGDLNELRKELKSSQAKLVLDEREDAEVTATGTEFAVSYSLERDVAREREGKLTALDLSVRREEAERKLHMVARLYDAIDHRDDARRVEKAAAALEQGQTFEWVLAILAGKAR